MIEESLTIGETVEGSIENAGDRIIYTFDGTLGQKLIYDGISGSFNIDARLISPAGQNLFGFSRDVNRDIDPLTLGETGTYQLIVDGNGSTTGDFSFRFLDANIATTIDFNTTVEGTVEPNTPTLFSFEGTEGQTLLLNSELFGLNYRVYSPSNEFIAGVGSEFIIPGDGTYLIVETRSSSNNQPVDYRFSVIETNSIDAALTIGETVEGSIENIGDRIIHNFDATVGQKLIYDGISGDSNIDVEFISPAGQSLFGFFNPNVNSDRDPLTLKETGTYQLIVDGNGSTTGDFSFRFLDANIATTIDFNTTVEGTVEPNTPTLFSFEGTEGQTLLLNSELFGLNYRVYSPSNEFIAGVGSEFIIPGDGTYLIVETRSSSNNQPVDYRFSVIETNSIDAALTIGETVEGSIENIGDRIIYTFDGTVGQRLIYDGISGNFNIDAELISPSGNGFFNRDVNSDLDPITLIEDGTYTLIVDANGNSTGEFSFNLSNGNTAPTLNFNRDIEGTLEPNTTSVLRFEGVANQTVTLEDLGSDSFTGQFRLISPGNQLITSSNFGFGFGATLPGDGTYFLLLDSSSNSLVNYRFRVI